MQDAGTLEQGHSDPLLPHPPKDYIEAICELSQDISPQWSQSEQESRAKAALYETDGERARKEAEEAERDKVEWTLFDYFIGSKTDSANVEPLIKS